MKRNGEDIIVTNTCETPAARALAAKVSKSRTHSWCSVWYVDSVTNTLTKETYSEGALYDTNRSALTFPGNCWFSAGRTRGLTILDAMVRYAECEYVRQHATRLGGTGKYSKY